MEDEIHKKEKENTSDLKNEVEDNQNLKEENKSIISMGTSSNHDSVSKIKNEQQLTKKMRENPWIFSTLTLSVVVILLLFLGNFSGNVTGNVTGNIVSENVIEDSLIELNQILSGE